MGARALKWVGAVTAVISLVLGAKQLTTWLGESVQRRRDAGMQVDLARQQASRGGFADAWASLDKAQALQPGESVDSARIDVAFAWLEDARPGPGRPFSTITDVVTPALDRAILTARGSRRSDLLAHLGWATFLRSRDGASGDPAARYHEALAIDAGNVYANAMLGHWLMWSGGSVESAGERFNTALAGAGEKRPFVRRLQLAALANRGESADAQLLRVANDMRQRGEPIDAVAANRIFQVFSMRSRRRAAPVAADSGIAPADLAATFDWILKASGRADGSPEVDSIRQRLRLSG